MMLAERTTPWTLDQVLRGFGEGFIPAVPVRDLTIDSRTVQPGTLFLACAGARQHGLVYLEEALRRGAVAVAYEPDARVELARVRRQARRAGAPLVAVPALTGRLGPLASRFFEDPSQSLLVIGVTGTNGKTTCSQFLTQALAVDLPSAVIGTLGAGTIGAFSPTGHTTPDAVTLQRFLAAMSDQGIQCVTLEVSSHGLHQGRVAGVAFDVAIFTNLSHDHLDYHQDMEAYGKAKAQLFQASSLRCSVINSDDSFGRALLSTPGLRGARVAYGRNSEVRDQAEHYVLGGDLVADATGLRMRVESSWGNGELHSPLLGNFNASNLLAVLGVLLWHGTPLPQALARCARLQPVAGRMQRLGGGNRPQVVIDYAHTPDALEQTLAALREHAVGRLWCVFGCGGERDRAKRPRMGRIAEQVSDQVIVTDDNPRREPSLVIINDILAGMVAPGQVRVVQDRAAAIRTAISEAASDDWILVAGKGHEDYQEVAGVKRPFSDLVEVSRALAEVSG